MTARLATNELRALECPPHDPPSLLQENARLRRENEALRRKVEELRNLSHLAFRDDLTGLPNRRYMEKRIREEIARVRRFPQQVFSILMIDINDFKLINDTHGHAKGDETLRWMADFLLIGTRETDICCRLAGDEFVIVLTNTDARSAGMAARRITRQLSDCDTAELEIEIPIRVSIGITTFGEPATDVDGLIQSADASMYREKRLTKTYPAVAMGPSIPDAPSLVRP